MLSVIGGIDSIHDCLRTVNCEIAMELDHGVPRIDQIRSVHLDFVVLLSTREGRSQNQHQDQYEDRICVSEMAVADRSVKGATSHKEDYQPHHEWPRADG